MKRNSIFSLRTVRKKILMITKLSGIILILSYVLSDRLPLERDGTFAVWMGLVVLIVLFIDFLMGHFISRPVSELNQAAGKMAQLDFSVPCTIHTDDEFGELAESLNIMAENLQRAISGLESANAQLEKEVEKERRLLAERKELADSLSHEMKTPLGVIRAYAEGIQDEAGEGEKYKYADIIIGETERMNNLLASLLDLSALENGAKDICPERFDFTELVETVAGRLLADSPDTDFSLEYELPEHRTFVFSDKERMEQVLDNFIVNAKKNVCPGGILRLSVTEDAGTLCFSVFNEGAPVPPGDSDKIWRKFYRGDTSKYKGSGLGLAIVAQILSMQNLKYGVENLPNGVRFYFLIPVIS
ncbi:MAG: HAMP domain-containing sensor histidine kinase [Eubacteriales bacterium]|nr:HAMP domain-containing sensor histidine kinase [Eubacteriales bacterium]